MVILLKHVIIIIIIIIIIISISIIIITQRAMDLACEKGASSWLTVIPLKDMDFDLNKREFRDAVRLLSLIHI